MEGVELGAPSLLLTLHSPPLSSLLSSLPCPPPPRPTLLLPDFPSSTVAALLQLLATGATSLSTTRGEVEDLANVLGVTMFLGTEEEERLEEGEEEMEEGVEDMEDLDDLE